MRLGIDVGSTTAKVVLLDKEGNIVHSSYERHMSNVFSKVADLLEELYLKIGDTDVHVVITGSGGLSLANIMEIPFEQEVISCSKSVEVLIPETDVAIELGGEDAKITYYGKAVEQRMNGTCAGGTGAFIDQMAVLLNTDAKGLNEAAKNSKIIYPIAARCGVFAKTDIQPLINEGASMEDLSASIFQAVVNQTISGLACGRAIKGNVAFLGGPLHFLSELRHRFIVTLELKDENIIIPENSQYFVALGAALISEKYEKISIKNVMENLRTKDPTELNEAKYLRPLFNGREEYELFRKRHFREAAEFLDIKDAKGPCYLGIDAGSTTTKAALIDANKNLLYQFYRSNEGKPLEAVKEMLTELYSLMNEESYIARACVTGYGEGLIKTGFNVDMGEIETIAHYKAAKEFLPGVEFILDIGGQDMKCIRIRDGVIYNIMLNEACSSGCGSFIETYAKSVDLEVPAFANEALLALAPVDLGTRCTVFMNSRVKQAQKEGATIGDISAGLSYSIIKNALYKVIKLRNPDEAGTKIVVQGGTFLNDAVLRAMELIVGKDVVRPNIAGTMGAFGAALLARKEYDGRGVSEILSPIELLESNVEVTNGRCKRCENNCLLTINTFNGKKRFITGNRCEKGAGKEIIDETIPNMYDYKYKRLFHYEPRKEEDSIGTIGIPRVLNMYENYPFWFTFFNHLGYRVVLSPHSNKSLYESGMETISSDTACYPAKLVHGHIKWLLKNDIKTIFYPCINYEKEEDNFSKNHYNCPVVATYPEVISKNMDDLFEKYHAELLFPFIPYDSTRDLTRELYKLFKDKGFSKKKILEAVILGRKEDAAFKLEIKEKTREVLNWIKENHKTGIVLVGRPYHLDPEINHGIDRLIVTYGMPVLTEDGVANFGKLPRPIRVLDQWVYHNRMYRAAQFTGMRDELELIQLNSFGCGLDAVTTDQIEEIMRGNKKLYTTLKIDEGSNLGAAKIRIRSLLAVLKERSPEEKQHQQMYKGYERKEFTRQMRDRFKYTILMPQMSPIHFDLLETALKSSGYNAVMLPPVDKQAVEEGLKYVNNDACYPTIVTLGQVISALKSGKYDLDKTAVFMSQTGGGCRASNYIALLRKALDDLNMGQIPVVSVNMTGLEKNSGFKLSLGLIRRILMAGIYGDTFMRVLYATRPYEKEKGSADRLHKKWARIAKMNVKKGSIIGYIKTLKQIVKEFDELPLIDIKKPRVGVVGEILVKYHPTANNDIIGIIESEGGEAVVLDLVDFFLYGMFSKEFNYRVLSGTFKLMIGNKIAMKIIERHRKPARKALNASQRFSEPLKIHEVAEKASEIVSLGNQFGEGWLLTGEMVDFIDMGVKNVVCLQPFACLPNHITGKGMMKALRKRDPDANVIAIDYDPGASTVNQLNRIKLMMAQAHKNLEKDQAG